MKNIKKRMIALLVSCLALGGISHPNVVAQTSTPEGYIKTESGLYIKKSVEKVEGKDDEYRISFDVSGTAPEVTMPTADIVLIIDRSGSMKGDKMTRVKESAQDFCKTILEGKNKNVKISVVSYSNSARLNIEQSNNLESLKSAIGKLNADGGTNTESGINEAKKIVSSINSDKKYVVLFTDGLPTYNDFYVDKNYMDENEGFYSEIPKNINRLTDLMRMGNRGSKTYDNDIKAAQRAFHNIVGGTGEIGGIAPWRYYKKEGNEYEEKNDRKPITEILTPEDISATADPNIKFYTMGLFTNTQYSSSPKEPENENLNLDDSMEEKIEEEIGEEIESLANKYNFSTFERFSPNDSTMAKQLLYSIQNIETNFNEYVKKYYTSSTEAMENIFKTIASEISGDINALLSKDTVIKDMVTDDFVIVEKENNDIKGIDKDKVTINGNNIEFEIGDILDSENELSNPDKTISFVVKPKDPYMFGENIPTNIKATIDHTDPIDHDKKYTDEEFNIPNITISPKKATITVEKIVNNPNGLNPSQDMKKEIFPILIKGTNEEYNIGLKSGEIKTMAVYLKGKDTNISTEYAEKYKENIDNKFDSNLNFLTVGKYEVSEIVPMNYKLVSINQSDFNIDKDNKSINIVVTNECINDKYFHDNEEKANELIYK